MQQTAITSFYNSRKRPAPDDLINTKNKVLHIDASAAEIIDNNTCKEETNVSSVLNINSSKIITKLSAPVILNCQDKTEKLGEPSDTVTKNEPEAFTKKVNATNIVKVNKPLTSSKDDLTKARKALNLGDIKKKLLTHPRFSELKERSQRLQQAIKDSNTKKNLNEFSSIELEVPVSPSKKNVCAEPKTPKKNMEAKAEPKTLLSPRKVVVSPIKSPRKVSAYMRHALLDSSTSLPLPKNFQLLAEMFRTTETVVTLFFNRNESVLFSKLKPSVQDMMKREFTKKHLAQIKSLVPDYYAFELQKLKKPTATGESYDLLITPNLPHGIKTMTPSVLLERRRHFMDTLYQVVKKHHAQFISSLDPPMTIPNDKLLRWHPEFRLDDIPDVQCCKLPEPPNNNQYRNAGDVLAKARELFRSSIKMEKSLQSLAEARANELKKDEEAAPKPSPSVELINPALRNLPTALLDLVKAKQAAKALETMTRSTEDENKFLTYSRLPELVRALRNIFVSDKKNVLALATVISKLGNTFKVGGVSSTLLQDDIKVLTEKVPELVKLHNVRNTTYLKFDRAINITPIISKLEKLYEKRK